MPDDLSIRIPEITAWVYITTNFNKTVLYTGSTTNIIQRLFEHYINQGLTNAFTSKYKAFYCIYYEVFDAEETARKREQEIKLLKREKKELIINNINPDWNFLNEQICGQWPPVGIKNRNQFWK